MVDSQGEKMKKKNYYLGLDIGTDSVGYAVTDEQYKLLRFKGESMWGSGLFDPATPCQERREKRTARRRLDRRQQRVRLLREFFAEAIAAVDSKFFVRLRESALFAEDRTDPLDNQTLFNEPSFKDSDFHHRYPTIHHLIVDLMNDPSPHDSRLVYIACAWLVAHRGHFLSEVKLENVSEIDDVTALYRDLMEFCSGTVETDDGETKEYAPMWECDPAAFGEVLSMRAGLTVKRNRMLDLLWEGKKPKSDDCKYNRYDVISLLCGSDTVKPSSLFNNDEYADYGKLFLGAEDTALEAQISELGDDGELIRKLKALYDWAVLKDVKKGASSISAAKVAVYDQHRKDLEGLKALLRKADKKLYRKVFKFVDEKTANYTAYVCNDPRVKRAKKDVFSEWLKKTLASLPVSPEDRAFYDDMMNRLDMQTFLPKQLDGDNRVIPHQLYQVELRQILKNASAYLPFLNNADEYGTVAEKIDSIFGFRIPYFVGPLVSDKGERGKFAWMERRKEGLIRPWNFTDLVDLDKSEDAFIKKMTNTCTYLPGEDVLPAESLLYKEFTVLNEINPLKIGGAVMTPDQKKVIVEECFKKSRKVIHAKIRKVLVQENLMGPKDEFSGIDETIKSNLSSYHDFKGWLDKHVLTEQDVESIIARSTCTEDGSRLREWLAKQPFASKLDENDIRKIARLNYSEFGRLSQKFLDGIVFEEKMTGVRGTVMEFMRRENVVLMELLSERYTLNDEIRHLADAYYSTNELTLEKRLDDMYVSSAVKRQIYRALDIVKTVRKVMGCAPRKVFVEMARGGTPDQKGKRTVSRYDNLVNLYRGVKDAEVKAVNAVLEKMGDGAHNRLQADALYLWTLQLGHCAYCGKPLPVEGLKSVANIDHIHPQSKVKDDSVMNNKVLCCSTCNDAKKDTYPVPLGLRQETLWGKWHKLGLMTDEKYRRLMRREMLTDEELQGFINRQLVETRQTTKAVFTILKDLLPESEIVAVQAGNVSDFRHEFDLPKCRAVNDLHHAKDAYLNVIVGNVYHERFSRQFFRLSDGYTMKIGKLFGEGSYVENAHGVAWNGASSLKRVKETMVRNDIHLTKYAYFAKGGLFDQMPKGPGESTIPRKKGLPVVRYGGYAKPSATGYLVVRYKSGKKIDVLVLPVDLLDVSVITGAESEARKAAAHAVGLIEGHAVEILDFPIGRRLMKVNSILSLDGFDYVIRGKSGGGKMYLLSSLRPLILPRDYESYVKRLESLDEKMKKNRNLVIDETYDKVTAEQNANLYKVLDSVCSSPRFAAMPASQSKVISKGLAQFEKLEIKAQIQVLLSLVQLLKTNRAGGCDLTGIGGVAKAGVLTISSKMSNWKKAYKDVRIVSRDFSGMYTTRSQNLLDLL